MNFQELKLLVVIGNLRPKRDPVSDQQRFRMAESIRDRYTQMHGEIEFPWSVSEVIELAIKYRKSAKNKIKAQIAARHGMSCFWQHRGKGPCDSEAEAGHIIPQASGADLTVENGMIECRAHNNQRRERSIEEYLSSEDQTEVL